ncbi:MAG: hypothetical protein IJP46_08145 [Prevotella sp.]|nr:hypothetical protein [Prevotella sp.]
MTARREKSKPQPPQLNSQLVAAKEQKAEKDEVAIEFGKFLLDLAKLTFGGMFLTAIMDLSYNMEKVIVACALIIIFMSIMGFVFIRYGNKKKKL